MKSKILKYEIDELILSSSGNEDEIPFVFMGGIAIQVESNERPIPLKSPVILTCPQKDNVLRNSKMRTVIAIYIEHEWDGDFYSIALKIGHINSFEYSK